MAISAEVPTTHSFTYTDAASGRLSGPLHSRMKRAIDIAGSGILIALLFLPFLAIALLIRADSAGPVFFRQERTGANGQTFRIWKLRTMYTHAPENNPKQAVRNDPRVTRIGSFLRSTSIDELAQLINVFRGEMSLIGPRPHAKAHDDYYGVALPSYYLRFHAKPGITGLAQVRCQRGETKTLRCMARRLSSDLEYIGDWSMWMDLRILAQSAFIFLRIGSAY